MPAVKEVLLFTQNDLGQPTAQGETSLTVMRQTKACTKSDKSLELVRAGSLRLALCTGRGLGKNGTHAADNKLAELRCLWFSLFSSPG